MRSISLPRPTSRPSDGCASQTTTVLLALWAQRSSTASKTFVRPTSEQNVACSTSKNWATSAFSLPRCGLAISDPTLPRYFTFLTECETPKACTILLRGPSKDVLNEIDRNLADAMSVARNVFFNPTLIPGGGATEMAVSVGLHAHARSVPGVEAGPFRAVADAMEVIPRTLIQNSGGNVIRVLTELRVS